MHTSVGTSYGQCCKSDPSTTARTYDEGDGAAGARVAGHGVAREQLRALGPRGEAEAVVVGDGRLLGLRVRGAESDRASNAVHSRPKAAAFLGCARRGLSETGAALLFPEKLQQSPFQGLAHEAAGP